MCIIIIIIISTGYCGLLVGVACDPRHCGSYPGLDDHTHLIKVFINCKLVHARMYCGCGWGVVYNFYWRYSIV